MQIYMGSILMPMEVAKRLKCIKLIPPGMTEHDGPHSHSLDKRAIHFCEDRSVQRLSTISPFE